MDERANENVLKKYPPYIPNKKPPSNFIDLTGKDYERFTVLYRIKDLGKWKVSYLCKCKCEKHTLFPATANNIKSGNTNSCGCYGREKLLETIKKYNNYDLEGEYGIGYTYQNEEFYFDLEDYNKIKNYCWSIGKKDDVEARIDGKLVKMHRLIMGVTDPNIKVDHIFHNEDGSGRRYDNRKVNLRLVTNMENGKNHKISSSNSSGVTGVCWDKRRDMWYSRIGVDNKTIYLGEFKNKEEAIRVRKEAENKYFGEYKVKNLKENKIC